MNRLIITRKIYNKIIDKAVLDFPNVRKQEAINRLRALPRHSCCNHQLSDGTFLAFYCNKKGVFEVYNNKEMPSDYMVYGVVSSNCGDARITVYKKKKNGVLSKLIAAITGAILIFATVLFFAKYELNTITTLIALALTTVYLLPLFFYSTDGDYQRKDAEIKYQELISIARTVSTWDEE